MNPWAIPLISLAATGPQLSTGVIEAEPHTLIEIRVSPQPPEGFEVLSQEWLVLDPTVDWRQYDNGEVFVATSAPGTSFQARWRGQYIRLEPLQGKADWRVYTIQIRGPPQPPPVTPPVVTPTPPDTVPQPDPTTPGPARQITYIHEHQQQQIPRPIQEALRRLREAGITATAIDKDIKDGAGQIPAQYRVALGAAPSGRPSAVIEDGKGGVLVIENPTEQDLLKYLP